MKESIMYLIARIISPCWRILKKLWRIFTFLFVMLYLLACAFLILLGALAGWLVGALVSGYRMTQHSAETGLDQFIGGCQEAWNKPKPPAAPDGQA